MGAMLEQYYQDLVQKIGAIKQNYLTDSVTGFGGYNFG